MFINSYLLVGIIYANQDMKRVLCCFIKIQRDRTIFSANNISVNIIICINNSLLSYFNHFFNFYAINNIYFLIKFMHLFFIIFKPEFKQKLKKPSNN